MLHTAYYVQLQSLLGSSFRHKGYNWNCDDGIHLRINSAFRVGGAQELRSVKVECEHCFLTQQRTLANLCKQTDEERGTQSVWIWNSNLTRDECGHIAVRKRRRRLASDHWLSGQKGELPALPLVSYLNSCPFRLFNMIAFHIVGYRKCSIAAWCQCATILGDVNGIRTWDFSQCCTVVPNGNQRLKGWFNYLLWDEL